MAGSEAGTLGALLRRYRQAAALSQEALAERAGLSAVTVSALERGVRRTPHLGTVELLATALALDASDRAALLAATRPSGGEQRKSPAADALVPLVGRERELALLDRFLAGARTPLGPATVLLLAGEPGIGKTRLLQAAAQRAIAGGWCVLVGGCQRRGGQEPYAPLLDTLAQHLRAASAAQRRAALAGCAWLVRLLPELAEDLEPLPAWTVPPEQERRLLFAAVVRLLTNVAGPTGTLLVLDDLQWAGPDALDLIDALARASAPLRLVGAYRDTEVRPADPLGLLVADLSQARLAQQQALGPLAEAEAAALLEDLLLDVAERDRATVERVLQRAEGTPFFLISYAQALQQGSLEGVPWDLAQGVRQRVALLPAAGQEILGAAATVGRRTARGLLAAAVGQPEEAVVAGLEAACRARLLLEEGEDAYVFAHDVIREVVEADVGAARRAVLHRGIAEALEGGPAGAPPELLAYHYARGGVPDRAVLYLERAGDLAWAQRAHGAAEGHYREALDRLEPLGRALDAARVREKLGEVLYRAGRLEAALEELEQAADAYRVAGDLDGLVRVMADVGRAHAVQGTPDEGLALLGALLERVERARASPPALGMLCFVRSWLLFTVGQYEAALAECERAAELARAAGDDRALALADGIRVNHLQMLGRLAEALRVGEEVLGQLEEAGDADALQGVLHEMATIYALQGDFSTSMRLFDRSIALAAQFDSPSHRSFILVLRGSYAVFTGDMPRAHADLDQALASSRQADRSWYSPYPLILHARLSLVEGEWATATASVQEAITLAEAGGDLQALRMACGVIAEIDIVEGRALAASARLVPLLDRPGLQECDVTMFLPVLAWAQLELGQVDLAAKTVEQTLARARPEEMRPVVVEALRVRALIALRRGRLDLAARSLEEGLGLARAMPYPYAEARLLHLGGLLHSAQGAPAAARERLETARAIFARLGARMDLQRIEEALGALSQNDGLGQFETVVSDAQWAEVQAVLPPPARTGRRRADDRRTLEAILYQRRTGCPWSALPAAFGDDATAHRRLRQWQASGLWERIAAIVQAPPTSEHGLDDGAGAPA